MGKNSKPIGYIERIGRCVIKKVSLYGKKYIVYEGQVFWRFATLRRARHHACERLLLTQKISQE